MVLRAWMIEELSRVAVSSVLAAAIDVDVVFGCRGLAEGLKGVPARKW